MYDFNRSILHNIIFKLAIYALVPLITLYSAITITVPPILFNQSGLQFRTFIEDTSKPIYVYGSYYTSIVYYMDTIPTQVFVDTTDDSIWTEGKTLMPTITKETFLSNTSNNRGAYVIVPKNMIRISLIHYRIQKPN